jgi:CheY-like chemotaxis protein
MTDIPKILEGIAAVAWPAIVILVVLLFRPAVAALIESAKSRKFTLKIGGQELSMDEANAQQRNLINDLQAQVLEIKKRIEATTPSPEAEPTRLAPRFSAGFALWVDDQPKNNSYFVQQLADKGVKTDLALSTAEGLRMFGKKPYAVIVSDMGRTEDGTYKPTAGLELLRQIREYNKTIPFIIFCAATAAEEHGQEAIDLQVTAVTSSPTEMFGILQNVFVEKNLIR